MTKVDQWNGKWACIGGGSAGLGLVLARQLVSLGANVAIVGRDPQRLDDAIKKLKEIAAQAGTTGKIIAFSVDLTESIPQLAQDHANTRDNSDSNKSSATAAFTAANEGSQVGSREDWLNWLRQTTLDLAIAAAGKSDRGFLMKISSDDLHFQLQANIVTAFHFSQQCGEALIRGQGTLVHIASVAGIVAAPGMGAYSIAKHAMVALSRQLRSELASEGVRVLLVCPGPVSNPDHVGRYDALVQNRNLPEDLKRPAGGNKIKALDADWLARRVMTAVEKKEKELILPSKIRWLVALGLLFPTFADFMLKPKK